MNRSLYDRLAACRRRLAHGEGGFTLIELLVVITILGVLAGIVLFSTRGVNDRGQAASKATDARTLRTAEEAYCAKFGHYGTEAQLVNPEDGGKGFIAAPPTLNHVFVGSGGNCGTGPQSSYVISGYQVASGTAFDVRVANNAFNPVNDDGIDAAFVNQFGATPTFTSVTSGPTATGINNGSITTDLFLSADEANVDAVDASKKIASTKTLYAIGQLAVYSCSGTHTGTTAADSPNCNAAPVAAPDGGAPNSVKDVADMLVDEGGYPTATFKVAIADPGGDPLTGPTVPTAPYGKAAREALIAPVAAGGGGLTAAQYANFVSTGKIQRQTGLNTTKTAVDNGASTGIRVALLGLSQVKKLPTWAGGVLPPGSANPNPWTAIAQKGPNGADTYAQIRQFGVVIKRASADPAKESAAGAFLEFLASGSAQGVLSSYGYLPLP